MIPRLRGIFLLAFWFASIAMVAPLLIALVVITKNENLLYSPVRLFIRAGLAMVGVRVEVTGLERLDPNQTYIFTPNHQSLIEVPLCVTYLNRNIAYLGKKGNLQVSDLWVRHTLDRGGAGRSQQHNRRGRKRATSDGEPASREVLRCLSGRHSLA